MFLLITCLSQNPHISRYPERSVDSFVCITCMFPLPSMLFGDPKRVPNTNWESSSHRTRLYTHNVCQIGYYSELSCVGEVAQMQSIQQTGFLGIRPGVKKSPFVLLLDCAVFSLSDFCWVTHVEKPVALCLKAQMAKMIFFINLHSFQFLIVIWGAKRSWGGKCLAPLPSAPPMTVCETHKYWWFYIPLMLLVLVLTQLIFSSQIRADY